MNPWSHLLDLIRDAPLARAADAPVRDGVLARLQSQPDRPGVLRDLSGLYPEETAQLIAQTYTQATGRPAPTLSGASLIRPVQRREALSAQLAEWGL